MGDLTGAFEKAYASLCKFPGSFMNNKDYQDCMLFLPKLVFPDKLKQARGKKP